MKTRLDDQPIERGLRIVEEALIAIAAVIVLVMMLLTTADVVMRYAFNSPLSWVFDLMTHYLIVASFFFSFSAALRYGDHVAVDYFAPRLPGRLRHPAISLAWLVCSALVTTIAFFALNEAYDAWSKGEVIAGAIPWPIWPEKLVIFVGLAPMAARMLLLSLGRARTEPDPGTVASNEQHAGAQP